MEKLALLTVAVGLAAMPAIYPTIDSTPPVLTAQLLHYGEKASNAVADIIGEKQFGREDAEWLVKHGQDSAEMTLLCGCAEGWSRFTALHAAFPQFGLTPDSSQALSDKLFADGKYNKEKIAFLFRNSYQIGDTAVDTDFQVLDGTVPAAKACSDLGRQGARLAFEMTFRTDKEGFARLRHACRVRWPYVKTASMPESAG
jgi:hypothetical protein